MKQLNKPNPKNTTLATNRVKQTDYRPYKPNAFKRLSQWVLGIFFFIVALCSIIHPMLLLIFGFIGFMIIPPGQNYIEKKLGFRLTTKIKAITTLLLLIASVSLINSYTESDTQEQKKTGTTEVKPLEDKNPENSVTPQDRDSIAFHIQQADLLLKQHKFDAATEQLNIASSFAKTPTARDEITKKQNDIALLKVNELIKARKYIAAIPITDKLLMADPDNSTLKYIRALCYSKTGKVKEAVGDLKPLVDAGNTDAEKLYNKINPVRKKIVGYETLCNDGSTSSARGRGACSHHGGVQDWNHPVYEESRFYE